MCTCEITFPLWKKKTSQFLIRRCCMCSHFAHTHTCTRLFHAVSVCILVYSCQCEAPLSFQPGVHMYWYLDVCARTWDRTLSYGLHAVTAESRLWDVPGCQEHPPPAFYRLTAFHSSVWMQMQSAGSPASSCHLETEPSASSSAWCEIRRLLPPYLLVCFTNVCCSLTKFELARLAWSCDWFWLEIATHFRTLGWILGEKKEKKKSITHDYPSPKTHQKFWRGAKKSDKLCLLICGVLLTWQRKV